MRTVNDNAVGGKDPWGGRDGGEGKREGMVGKSGPNNPGGRSPVEKVQEPQNRLGNAVNPDAGCRVPTLIDLRSDDRRDARDKEIAAPGVIPLYERPPVSRVRENRMHGLKGGPASILRDFPIG